jgi:hypothetical protein
MGGLPGCLYSYQGALKETLLLDGQVRSELVCVTHLRCARGIRSEGKRVCASGLESRLL